MNTEKFQAMVNDFANLIADYNACKSPVAKLALEKSIIVFAKNIARIDNCAIVEKKSDMACNCKHDDTAQEKSIDEILADLKKWLTQDPVLVLWLKEIVSQESKRKVD